MSARMSDADFERLARLHAKSPPTTWRETKVHGLSYNEELDLLTEARRARAAEVAIASYLDAEASKHEAEASGYLIDENAEPIRKIAQALRAAKLQLGVETASVSPESVRAYHIKTLAKALGEAEPTGIPDYEWSALLGKVRNVVARAEAAERRCADLETALQLEEGGFSTLKEQYKERIATLEMQLAARPEAVVPTTTGEWYDLAYAAARQAGGPSLAHRRVADAILAGVVRTLDGLAAEWPGQYKGPEPVIVATQWDIARRAIRWAARSLPVTAPPESKRVEDPIERITADIEVARALSNDAEHAKKTLEAILVDGLSCSWGEIIGCVQNVQGRIEGLEAALAASEKAHTETRGERLRLHGLLDNCVPVVSAAEDWERAASLEMLRRRESALRTAVIEYRKRDTTPRTPNPAPANVGPAPAVVACPECVSSTTGIRCPKHTREHDAKPPLAPVARPVCSRCNDTHMMPFGEDHPDVMCTFCPTPCQKCRAGGNGPFCEKTPCDCACHKKTSVESTNATTAGGNQRAVGASANMPGGVGPKTAGPLGADPCPPFAFKGRRCVDGRVDGNEAYEAFVEVAAELTTLRRQNAERKAEVEELAVQIAGLRATVEELAKPVKLPPREELSMAEWNRWIGKCLDALAAGRGAK